MNAARLTNAPPYEALPGGLPVIRPSEGYMNRLIERCAMLDIHKSQITACVRVPDGDGGRRQEVAVGSQQGFLSIRPSAQASFSTQLPWPGRRPAAGENGSRDRDPGPVCASAEGPGSAPGSFSYRIRAGILVHSAPPRKRHFLLS